MKKEIKERFKRLGISIVYLFGSRVRGGGNKLSDIDIGVVLKDLPSSGDTRVLYNALYKIFSESYSNSKIDIVFLQAAPLSLQYSAIKDGKFFFEEDPIFTADYEYGVINQYLDFRPVLDFFDHIGAERYAQE
jgi:predicted nucleotidyltransferase